MAHVLAVLMAASIAATSIAINNGRARTPPMGFSTWNWFPTTGVNQTACTAIVNAMLSPATNLTAAGYNVFIVDEPCFSGRDSNGNLIVPTSRWPQGFDGFASFLHANGMQLGLYSPTTCGGCIASEGYESKDMSQWASWGVDYVKVDSCNRNVDPAHWAVFETALNATGQHITFSIIAQGQNGTIQAGGSIGNLWRTTGDIMNRWDGVMSNLDAQSAVANVTSFAGPGGWNDPDMLQIGNTPTWQGTGLALSESAAHFAIWAVLKAPLLLSFDIDPSLPETAPIVAIATHPELIAINQDSLGAQPVVMYDYASWYMAGEWIWPETGLGVSSSIFSANFSSCGNGGVITDANQQVWNYTGTTGSPGLLVSASLDMCLVPAGCSNTTGTPLIIAACDHYPAACYIWSYDFYTTNEWKHEASSFVIQDNGGAAPPTLEQGNDGLNQRFAYNPTDPNIMAADTGLCLSTAPAQVTLAGPLSSGAIVAAALNRGQVPFSGAQIKFTDVGIPAGANVAVRDVLAMQELGNFTTAFPLPAIASHGAGVYTFTA